ncbi:MAG: hypothetical protein RL328_1717 [Acidobacteriota bacterium]
MNQQEQNNSGTNPALEKVLEKHLAPVSAPANLWSHVRGPVRAVNRPAWTAWAGAAATLTLAAGGWGLWQATRPRPSVEAMAVAALDQPAAQLPLLTQDANTVRKWIKTESGLDVPLPPKHDGLVKILGARIDGGRDGQVAEISYQVGEYRAALLVAKDPSGKRSYPNHDVRSSDPYQKARVSSWSMRGQTYTLAWSAPGEFRVACLLCHSGQPPDPPAAI